MEVTVKQAIERGELRLQYQPTVSLATGKITGFEALLRWQHPERGLLTPGEFLPLAEETQQMVPITQWVLREACRQIRLWQGRFRADPPLAVSVNLPLEYLKQHERLEEIAALMMEAGVIPYTFGLEITDRHTLEDAQTFSNNLLYLKSFGASFYIDNFGTGYSSLQLLGSLPIGGLKLDRYFVHHLFEDNRMGAVVKWIVSLGLSLGVDVIAKGIETPEQKDFLQEANCPYGQGHYFAPPVDQEAAARLLAKGALAGGAKKVDISRLRPFELFAGFKDEDLAEIAQTCSELSTPSETVIIRQGQVGSEMYLLEEGSMSIYRELKGETRALASIQAPSVFGEMALMNPERIRTASVKAMSDARLLTIHIGDFRALLRRFPDLKTRLQQLIAQRTSGR